MAINLRLKSLADEVQELQAERDARAFAWLSPYLRILDAADLAVVAEVRGKQTPHTDRTNLVLKLFWDLDLSTPENRQPVLEFERELYPSRVAEREAEERAERDRLDAIRLDVYTRRLEKGPCTVFEDWLRDNGHPASGYQGLGGRVAEAQTQPAPPPTPPPAAGEICARYVGQRSGFQIMTTDGPKDVRKGEVYSLPLRTWQNIERLGKEKWERQSD